MSSFVTGAQSQFKVLVCMVDIPGCASGLPALTRVLQVSPMMHFTTTSRSNTRWKRSKAESCNEIVLRHFHAKKNIVKLTSNLWFSCYWTFYFCLHQTLSTTSHIRVDNNQDTGFVAVLQLTTGGHLKSKSVDTDMLKSPTLQQKKPKLL